MESPRAAFLVIGDEILSGRTRDANTHHLAQTLTDHAIRLTEVRVVSDDESVIVDALRALSSSYDYVFTSGGIGPTHDDITADAVAAAFDADIGIRSDARELLAAHYADRGIEFNAARQRMARIPEGAELIENPVSVAPGFSLGNVFVMAGVPNIFQAMLAGVVPKLTGGDLLLSASVEIWRGEGEIADRLARLAAEHSHLSIGSYPFSKNGRFGVNIVIRGTSRSEVDEIAEQLTELLD